MPPTIQTARIIMRPFKLSDTPEFHRVIYGDSDVVRYLPGGVPRTPDETHTITAKRIQSWVDNDFSMWALIEQDTGSFVGEAGLLKMPGTPIIEVGYAMGKPFWGKGYATEVAQASLRFGFETLYLESISAVAVPENTASRNVLEKLGMAFEGIKADPDGDLLAWYVIHADDFTLPDAPYTLIASDD